MTEPAAVALEYRRIGRLPTCIGNERLRVSDDGRVFHARNTAECAKGQVWSAPWREIGRLDASALASLADDARASGILNEPAAAIDDTAEGGSREELDLTLDGKTFHWVVQNADAPAFRTVVTRLWSVFHSLSR